MSDTSRDPPSKELVDRAQASALHANVLDPLYSLAPARAASPSRCRPSQGARAQTDESKARGAVAVAVVVGVA